MSLFKSAFCTVLCLLVAGTASANLIINGGFEEPVVVGFDPAIGFNAGYDHRIGTELTGWATYSSYRGTVQFNSTYDLVGAGAQAVQIEVGGDSISQSFATIVGGMYLLSFDMSAYNGSGNTIATGVLKVSVGDTSALMTGIADSYTHYTLMFTSDASISTLVFENADAPGAWGNYPHLDNVSVEAVGAVPEPETYALLLAGLCMMGFATRCRKPQAD